MEDSVGQQSTEHGHLLPPAGLETAGRAFFTRKSQVEVPGGFQQLWTRCVGTSLKWWCWPSVGCSLLVLISYQHPLSLEKNPPGAFPGSGAVEREGAGLQLSPLLKPGRGKGGTKKGHEWNWDGLLCSADALCNARRSFGEQSNFMSLE